MNSFELNIETMNSPTVIQLVVQLVKRRRINIVELHAKENDKETGNIKLCIQTEEAQLPTLKKQLEKIIDVVAVK